MATTQQLMPEYAMITRNPQNKQPECTVVHEDCDFCVCDEVNIDVGCAVTNYFIYLKPILYPEIKYRCKLPG